MTSTNIAIVGAGAAGLAAAKELEQLGQDYLLLDASHRWQLRLRGDGGGLGVGSDFSWSASASALYKMNDRLDLEIGYKAIDVDYDNGDAANDGFFAYDATTSGPLLGLIIKF